MKLASWNVNGLRAAAKKGFWDVVRGLDADVLGLQEVRTEAPPELPEGFESYRWYWNAGERKGYAGVGVLARAEPLTVRRGIGHDEFDEEGRVITLEYECYYVVNAYFPNAGRGLPRLGYKLAFDQAIENYLEGLRARKGVVLMGDLNVAHREIDIARPKQNQKSAGFTPEERAWIDAFLKKGWVDSFRHLHPDEAGAYTWWTYRFNARAKNIGWRIDYIIISEDLLPHLKDAYIYYDAYASDHVPVVAVLDV
ncbi:exodeoxyribonuclease III [Oceanithermus sp.]